MTSKLTKNKDISREDKHWREIEDPFDRDKRRKDTNRILAISALDNFKLVDSMTSTEKKKHKDFVDEVENSRKNFSQLGKEIYDRMEEEEKKDAKKKDCNKSSMDSDIQESASWNKVFV